MSSTEDTPLDGPPSRRSSIRNSTLRGLIVGVFLGGCLYGYDLVRWVLGTHPAAFTVELGLFNLAFGVVFFGVVGAILGCAAGLRGAAPLEAHQPNHEQGDFHRLLQAFIERDYRRCVGEAAPFLQSRPTYDVLQIILISLLRSGGTELAEQIGAVAVDEYAGQTWRRSLLELTLGRIAPSALRGLAETDLHRCQLLYYSGARHLTDRQVEQAARDFEACREIGFDCLEKLLARLDDPYRTPIDEARMGSADAMIPPAIERLLAEGRGHLGRGENRAAEPLLRRALDECQAMLGSAHPLTGAVLRTLAVSYRRLTAPQGDDMPPEVRQLRDLIASRPPAEDEYAGFATDLHTQAEIRLTGGSLLAGGSLDDAERIARGAATIRRVVLGETHPDYATSLRLLADTAQSRVVLDAAGSLYRQALEIHSVMLDEGDPERLKSLQRLGRWQAEVGDHASANLLLRKALRLYSEAHIGWGETLADILSALVDLEFRNANLGEADRLSRSLVDVARRVFGELHGSYAESLRIRAEIVLTLADWALSEQLLREALAIYRQQNVEGYRPYGNTLISLAMLYWRLGRLAEAMSTLEEAQRYDPGPRCLNALGVCLWQSGDLGSAESALLLALEARQVLGEDHPDLAPVLSNLGGLYASIGRSDDALSLLLRSESLVGRIIGQAFSLGSDRQRMAILARYRGNLDAFLAMVVSLMPGSQEAVDAAFDLVLRRKAVGAEALAMQRDAILAGKYPELQHSLREWFTLRAQIARKSFAGPGPEGMETIVSNWRHGMPRKSEWRRTLPGRSPR